MSEQNNLRDHRVEKDTGVEHPSRSWQAAIFDMDGLMLDSERVGLELFRKAARDLGYHDLEPVYLSTFGRNAHDTREIFSQALGEEFPFDKLISHWRGYLKEEIEQRGIAHKPGLLELLAELDRTGLKLAVATSTPRAMAVELLQRAGVHHRFQTIVAGDEIVHGKPNPEIFLIAAARLAVAPSACIVFEDSPAGIQAAHAAAMTPILIPDLISPSPEICALAHRRLATLNEAIALFKA